MPDEAGDELGRGCVVDARRAADLLDPALAHDDDPVGQRQRLLLVVGHVHGRDAELLLDRPDLRAQRDADLGVERRERLVEEQHLRLDRERARERDALLHAARELPRVARPGLGHVDELEQLGDALPDRVLADPLAHPHPEADVVRDRHVREERVRLEHHAHVAPVRRRGTDVRPVERRCVPALGISKPAIIRRVVVLPQPDGPEERDELAALDREVEALDGDLVAELLADAR